MSKTPIILGIDPGTQILGYAIIQGGVQPKIIMMDVLKLTKEKIAKMMESLGLSVEEFDEWFKNAPFTEEIVGSDEAVRT